MIYSGSVELIYLLSAVILISECTIDMNVNEFQYLSDHLTQEECHKLVAALHFPNFEIPPQVAAAERKLPEDVPCLDLLLHWNSELGEGKGGTHVEVSHRLNQIGRRDLAQWLSKTVFHELSKDLQESVANLVPEETTRLPPTRVTEIQRKPIDDESPWLNLDSVLSLLLVLAIITCSCGCLYFLGLCFTRKRSEKKLRDLEKKMKCKKAQKPGIIKMPKTPEKQKETKRVSESSGDEKSNLIPKKKKRNQK